MVFQALPDLAPDHFQSPRCTRLPQWRKRISFSWSWFLPSSLGPPFKPFCRGNDSFISSESVISYGGGGYNYILQIEAVINQSIPENIKKKVMWHLGAPLPLAPVSIQKEADLFRRRIINVRIAWRHPSITVTLKGKNAGGLTLKYFQSQIYFKHSVSLERSAGFWKAGVTPTVVSTPCAVTQKVSNLKDNLGIDQNCISDLLLFQQTKDLIFLQMLFPEGQRCLSPKCR